MKKLINLVWALLTGAAVLALANSSTIMHNATNTTNTAVGNISGIVLN